MSYYSVRGLYKLIDYSVREKFDSIVTWTCDKKTRRGEEDVKIREGKKNEEVVDKRTSFEILQHNFKRPYRDWNSSNLTVPIRGPIREEKKN